MTVPIAAPPGLLSRMIGFIGHLRENDFAVGPAETERALCLFEDERWLQEGQARLGLRILLTSRRDEWRRFDDLFEAYWHRRGRLRELKTSKPEAATGKQHPEIWRDHLERGEGTTPKQGVIQEAVDDDAAAFEGSDGRLLDQLNDDITDERKQDLHSPAGFDLGAVEPEEIALSILGEIIKKRRRRR